MDVGMRILRRSRETALPNNFKDASESAQILYGRALERLRMFCSTPDQQEKHARRFIKAGKRVVPEPAAPAAFYVGNYRRVPSRMELIVISDSSSSSHYYSSDEDDEIDEYDDEEEEEDEEEEYQRLLADIERKREAANAVKKVEEAMADSEGGEQEIIEISDDEADDEGMEADKEPTEDDEGSETFSILAHEDQPPQVLESSSSESGTENEEEERRGRSLRRKRLNGMVGRRSSDSAEVDRPLKKAKRAIVDDHDEAMEEPRRQISAAEEEYWRQQLADELMLPLLERTPKRAQPQPQPKN
ncbi:hypothetical protein FQN54_001477 [Arachnomyces sp. PD_36]|nr:hypothetical protein FQN54_001477 [Arachnomyces sp. PD_36]